MTKSKFKYSFKSENKFKTLWKTVLSVILFNGKERISHPISHDLHEHLQIVPKW